MVLSYLIEMSQTCKHVMSWARSVVVQWLFGLSLGLGLSASNAQAQVPVWEVDASDYQYSASLFFAIVENGVLSADGGNLLGFFDADGTCRGSSGVTYIESTDSFVGGMLVHFNQVNPTLNALVYVGSMDTIIQVETPVLNLVPQASNGSIFNPVLVAVTYDVPSGCTNSSACNFNAAAQADDGSCLYPGCMDEMACNFDASAPCEELLLCNYAESGYDCAGECVSDSDEDGICDGQEVYGCTHPNACNYDDAATEDDCSCVHPILPYDCNGDCLSDQDGDGICDEFEIGGCTDSAACNYSSDATDDDGSCGYCCANSSMDQGVTLRVDTVLQDGVWTALRMHAMLPSAGDRVLAVGGEGIPTLISTTGTFYQSPFGGPVSTDNNLNETLFDELDSWVTIGLDGPATGGGQENPEFFGNDFWSMLFEFGEDIFLSSSQDHGWQVSSSASNALPEADGSVLLGQFTTDGTFQAQVHLQVLFEGAESPTNLLLSYDAPSCGCMDSEACNYDDAAEENDGSCVYALEGFDCSGACVDANNNGVCDNLEVFGCTNPDATNFDAEANVDDGGCLIEGCTYTTAINYQPQATMDDQSCLFELGEEGDCPDLDGDASVATSDLLIFLAAFGLICGQ